MFRETEAVCISKLIILLYFYLNKDKVVIDIFLIFIESTGLFVYNNFYAIYNCW